MFKCMFAAGGSGLQELKMNQHGNFWPLIGVHSQVLAEVLDTAER